MARKHRVYDRAGNLVELEDGEPVPDGYTVQVDALFMDGKSAPAGYYTLIDRCGRPAGLGRVDLAEKAAAARSDYAARLANAHRKLVPRTVADVLTPPTAPPSQDPNSEMTASRAAYLKYVRRISNMWRRKAA